jgi:hypothetical protein
MTLSPQRIPELIDGCESQPLQNGYVMFYDPRIKKPVEFYYDATMEFAIESSRREVKLLVFFFGYGEEGVGSLGKLKVYVRGRM